MRPERLPCNAGLQDCNGSKAPDTDGCECAGTGCCSGKCQTAHSNGNGQTFYDCAAGKTHNETQAGEACAALTGGSGACSAKSAGCNCVLLLCGSQAAVRMRVLRRQVLLLAVLRPKCRHSAAEQWFELLRLLRLRLGSDLELTLPLGPALHNPRVESQSRTAPPTATANRARICRAEGQHSVRRRWEHRPACNATLRPVRTASSGVRSTSPATLCP